MKQHSRKLSIFHVDPDTKFVLVIRINGLAQMSPLFSFSLSNSLSHSHSHSHSHSRYHLSCCTGRVGEPSVKAKRVLHSFHLSHFNTAVFVQVTPTTLSMLRLIEPYTTFGYPTLKTVKHLITKRGHTFVDGKRTPIKNNTIVETALASKGMICIEVRVNHTPCHLSLLSLFSLFSLLLSLALYLPISCSVSCSLSCSRNISCSVPLILIVSYF